MKIVCFVLLGAAIVFCVLGLSAHKEAWASAALCFFAAIMVYTLDDNGEPVQIFSSIERNRYYYAGGIRFANIGSSSADSSFVTTLKLEGEGLVDMTFTTDPKDYVQMQLVPIAEGEKQDG